MKRAALRVVERAVAELKPYDRNARTHSAAQVERLARSVTEFGWTNPVLVSADGTVIAGHARLEAAKLLKLERVPTVELAHLSPDQVRAYVLADNKLALDAGWDEDLLRAELEQLEGAGFDLGLAGFTDAELAELDLAPPPPETEEEQPVEPIEAPASRPGDLWRVGEHRVGCGDAFDEGFRARLLLGAQADVAVCDPPYAIFGSSTGVASDVADDKMVRPFFEKLCRALQQSSKPFAHLYVCTDWRSWSALWEGARAARLTPRNMLVWDKGGGGLGANYANAHELVAFLANLPEKKGFKKEVGVRPVHAANILRYPRTASAGKLHNAQKPVALLEHLVTNSSEPGELVLDLFGGSGSVLAACARAGRRSATAELEPRWVDVALRRAQAIVGAPARLDAPGDPTLDEVLLQRRGA